MNNEEKYKQAKESVEAKLGFYIHLFIYVLVCGFLILLNLTTNPDYYWFKWPVIGWGIGVFAHGFAVLFFSEGSSIKKRMIEKDRRNNPSLWRVLIDERNTLMAARTAWIVNQKMDNKEKPKLLAFVGAAHTDGIKKLLKDPILIKNNLKEYNLSFTKPSLIRRTSKTN